MHCDIISTEMINHSNRITKEILGMFTVEVLVKNETFLINLSLLCHCKLKTFHFRLYSSTKKNKLQIKSIFIFSILASNSIQDLASYEWYAKQSIIYCHQANLFSKTYSVYFSRKLFTQRNTYGMRMCEFEKW